MSLLDAPILSHHHQLGINKLSGDYLTDKSILILHHRHEKVKSISLLMD